MPDGRESYRIFARDAFDKPLRQVKVVDASDGQMLSENIRSQQGAETWIEAVAIPESAIRHVVKAGETV